MYCVLTARRGLDFFEVLFQGPSICILQQHVVRPIQDKAPVEANDTSMGSSDILEILETAHFVLVIAFGVGSVVRFQYKSMSGLIG